MPALFDIAALIRFGRFGGVPSVGRRHLERSADNHKTAAKAPGPLKFLDVESDLPIFGA